MFCRAGAPNSAVHPASINHHVSNIGAGGCMGRRMGGQANGACCPPAGCQAWSAAVMLAGSPLVSIQPGSTAFTLQQGGGRQQQSNDGARVVAQSV
jgi:hypothetical protein